VQRHQLADPAPAPDDVDGTGLGAGFGAATAEESVEQARHRARRIGFDEGKKIENQAHDRLNGVRLPFFAIYL
jgi:hypothetical protein